MDPDLLSVGVDSFQNPRLGRQLVTRFSARSSDEASRLLDWYLSSSSMTR
jgi:hypothetical protein